jgi:hypothetical protein
VVVAVETVDIEMEKILEEGDDLVNQVSEALREHKGKVTYNAAVQAFCKLDLLTKDLVEEAKKRQYRA